MKKALALLLAAVMILSLAACGSTEGSRETAAGTAAEDALPSGKIVFLSNRTDLDNDGTYAEMIARFNEQYPDVEVEVQTATDYNGELATRLQTEEYGDVLMVASSFVPNTELSKYFAPYGTLEELGEKYTEEYLYGMYYDGQVYGIPHLVSCDGFVYNKAVFEKAGITKLPATPEEFVEAMQMIKDNTDAIPYYTNTAAGWPLNGWTGNCYASCTGDPDYQKNILPHDAKAYTPEGPLYVGFKLLHDIVNLGLTESDPYTTDWESSKMMMNNGEIGCMNLGLWAIKQIQDAGEHPEDISIMPFPYTVDGKQYAGAGPDLGYAINVHTKNPEAARAFVEFMVEQSNLALDCGSISVVKSDPLPAGLEAFENVQFVVARPATEENTGLFDAVQQDSGITLEDGGLRAAAVVDIARGASNETFEEFMAALAEDWAAAVK